VLARQKVVEGLLAGTTDSGAVAERLAQMAQFDLADDYYDSLLRDVASLTLKDFHPFLGRELAVGGQVFSAFGNFDPVKAAVAGAKMGPMSE
jgi:hypothetical protein